MPFFDLLSVGSTRMTVADPRGRPDSDAAAPLDVFSSRDGDLSVVEVLGTDGLSRRLCELGLCEGRIVSVLRRGDPAIVRIDGSRYALSGELQSRILVQPRWP